MPAYPSWKYIETPFGNRAATGKRKIFLLSVTGPVMFSAFGFTGHKTDGFPDYITTQHQRDILKTAIRSPEGPACHTGGSDYSTYKESCEYFPDNVTLAVFGDSHAVELAYALAEELQQEGQGVKHLSFGGCVPA